MTQVAVYGSLRKGMHNHCLLTGEGSTYIGTTMTADVAAMYSLGGFPMVSLNGDKISHIVVEIYEVDDKCLARLNQLEGYRGEDCNNFYDRSLIKLQELGEAYIYHIEDSPRRTETAVPNGDWVDFYGTRYS